MSSNSLKSQKGFYGKFIFGLVLSALILFLSSLPKSPLSSPLPPIAPTPTPAPQIVKQYFSESDIEKLFQTPPLSNLAVRDVKFIFMSNGVVNFYGKLETGELSRISSTTEALSPIGYKLLQSFPATSEVHIGGTVSIKSNVLKTKITKLEIAGFAISSNILNADKLVSQWFGSYLSAHPGLMIEHLDIEKDRMYFEAIAPSGFAF